MPDLPRTARGVATRRRLLDAAIEEFAERGIAGARIERITETAAANKAQLYGYFGNKDGLFEETLQDCVQRSMEDTPFDAQDLPGWAVQLYDQNLKYPHLVRLIAWTRLERRPTGRWFDGPEHDPKLAAVEAAQAAGHIRPGDAVDILSLVIAMAGAWSPISGGYSTTARDPEADHDRRRTLLREIVRQAVSR